MFTGIVEEAGRIASLSRTDSGTRLRIRSRACAEDIRIGDSLAINGCCLTVVEIEPANSERVLAFDILQETWQRTNLRELREGSAVNLERPLAASGRFHGHIVTGHIDGVGVIRGFEPHGSDWHLEIEPPFSGMRYLVEKGSVAIDGISLTVAALSEKTFTVWIIPHTREVTAFGERKAGDSVNLEFDIIAKHVERLLAKRV